MTAKKFPVVVDSWTEYERGWGPSPAGFSAHLTSEDHEAFVREYNTKYNNLSEAPSCYQQADMQPRVMDVSAAVYRKLKNSKQRGIFLEDL